MFFFLLNAVHHAQHMLIRDDLGIIWKSQNQIMLSDLGEDFRCSLVHFLFFPIDFPEREGKEFLYPLSIVQIIVCLRIRSELIHHGKSVFSNLALQFLFQHILLVL